MAKAKANEEPKKPEEVLPDTAEEAKKEIEEKVDETIARIKKMDKPAIIAELKNMNIKDVETFSLKKLKDVLLEALVASKEIPEPKKPMTEVPNTTRKKVDKKELKKLQQEGKLVGFDPETRVAIIKD